MSSPENATVFFIYLFILFDFETAAAFWDKNHYNIVK